ncbi:uncharacterized protein LOC116001176 [Ipomoea triloba]|uniref:uncharacterized protein LOC116001176 n=1 Tax=Ipomoea triloba TaxID=35885 RepID=UPI00125D75E6|nr:uncharacterized protein LOC116001176 [Ipomoea triloba]
MFSSQRCADFAEWITNKGLIDMGFTGPKLTWSRGNTTGSAKGARKNCFGTNDLGKNGLRRETGTQPIIMRPQPFDEPVIRFKAYEMTMTLEGSGGFPTLLQPQWDDFNKAITITEVHKALTDMAPFKAPGPDGFHAAFYQRMWSIVGESVFKLVKEAFDSGSLPPGLNDTLLVLIPKVKSPETVRQFKPISLCNVSYKIITKTITNRLKGILPSLVGPYQSSVVQGHQISDNILIYQEIMPTMRSKKGQTGFMAIKLDFEKAYNRLSWDFIRSTLAKIGFGEAWITLIMHCIQTPRMALIWNGEIIPQFTPSRGIRQGDAMSPAIFVLCMERLSQMITRSVSAGLWKGIRLSSSSPPLSHLCFADDLVLFSEVSSDQVAVIRDNLERYCDASGVIRDNLERYCDASGQKINYAKSQVYFSKNVAPAVASDFANRLNLAKTDNLGTYLGVQSAHGRIFRQNFGNLLDLLKGRMEGWKARILSLAGRVTLAKSVLNSIPTYAMQTAVLPIGVRDMWEEGRGWKWELITDSLPDDIKLKLSGFVPSRDPERHDEVGWGPDPTGDFSIHSAYTSLLPSNGTGNQDDWLRIWKLNVPNRICVFVWLVQHGKILTNVERARRHITSNASCSFCVGHSEDCEHLFRRCGEAKAIWSAAYGPTLVAALGHLGWKEWLTTNLRGEKRMGFAEWWPERFSIRLWWLWKWRNDKVFNNRSLPFDQKLRWIKRQEDEIKSAFVKVGVQGLSANRSAASQVSWTKPTIGYVKLNVDGSWSAHEVKAGCGGVIRDAHEVKAGCGGVIRDHDGNWLGGFVANIGICSVEEVEAWAVWHGLRFALNRGYQNLIVESDSRTVIELLNHSGFSTGGLTNLLERCREEMVNFQSLDLCHVFREQNRIADALAKLALVSPRNFTDLSDAPDAIATIIYEDRMGVSSLRRVPVSGAMVTWSGPSILGIPLFC